MLPSLSQLPIGAPGPKELARDFVHMYMLRLADKTQSNSNEELVGRVLDEHSNPQHVIDEAERWRQKELGRMQRRSNAGEDRVRGYRTTHRTDPIPPVPWNEGVEVLADGSLVNVLASTLEMPEADVPVQVARLAVRDATGRSSAELARVVTTISDTDGGTTLGRWAFGHRLRQAVPALTTAIGVSWIVGALYNVYLLKEEVEMSYQAQWLDWNAVTGDAYACVSVARSRNATRWQDFN